MTLLVVIGLIVGSIMGLLGGGGTVVLLPLLVYIAEMGTHQAIATSLVVVGIAAASGAIQHGLAGRVRLRLGLVFGLASMLGAFPGGWSAQFFAGHTLMVIFGVMMALAGVAMLRPHRDMKSIETIRWGWILLEGLLVGYFTGLVGAGGGFLIVPALVILGGIEMKAAVGTSLFIMSMKSVAALAGQLSHVSLDWSVVLVVSAAAVLGSLMGAFAARWFAAKQLRTAFGVLVLALATHALWTELIR